MEGLIRKALRIGSLLALVTAIDFYSPPAAANPLSESHTPPGATSSFSPEKIHFESYLHLRYSFFQKESHYPIDDSNWSLRRLKVIVNWKLNQQTQFCSQLIYKTHNNSDTDDRIYLQHAYVKLFLSRLLYFKIGQFKPPFGWERFQSDSRIPTVERSQAIDRLIPNGSLGTSFVRDYGMQFFGKLSPAFQYECALMAGSGTHTKFSDKNAPLMVGRLSFNKNIREPVFRKDLKLSLQLAHSQRRNTDNDFTKQLPGCDKNIFQHFSGRDTRWNYAITLNAACSQFAAEYLTAEYLPDDSRLTKIRAGGWFLEHSCFFRDNWQSVIKYEYFDPDHAKKDSYDLEWLTMGLNYYFNNNHNRVMVNYVVKNEVTGELKNNMLVVQLQYFLFGDS